MLVTSNVLGSSYGGLNTDEILGELRLSSHPRTINVKRLSKGILNDSDTHTRLVARVKLNSVKISFTEPNKDSGHGEIRRIVFEQEKQIIRAAIAWLSTGDSFALHELKNRALQVASWDPKGTTGFLNHDQAGRSIAWTLSLVFDWAHKEFSTQELDLISFAVKVRVNEMLNGNGPYSIDMGKKLDLNPLDSHGVILTARLTVICSIFSGYDPIFDDCFKVIVPRYIKKPIPWGSSDGGYANGTFYAQWDVLFTHFVVWELLKTAINVNLWNQPWVKGYAEFVAYFLPPGTPSGKFGDGAEEYWPDIWATQARVLGSRLRSPLLDWYIRQWSSEDNLDVVELITKTPPFTAQLTRDLPNKPLLNSSYIESIGWVAMHSDILRKNRTSIYFKSSPFGSYNHSHADQNSFVIHSNGERLIIDSGHYDSFGSYHHKLWYRQTKSHNAITYDQGKGQMINDAKSSGSIVQFEEKDSYVLVTGDAVKAYGQTVTKMRRTLLYVRPDTLVIYDNMASTRPHKWEWNVHSLNQIGVREDLKLTINSETTSACVEMIIGPKVKFVQSNEFSAEPVGDYSKQWHGSFVTQHKLKSTIFVFKIVVDCKPSDLIIESSDNLLKVYVDGENKTPVLINLNL